MIAILIYVLIALAASFFGYLLGLRHGKTEQEELIEKAALMIQDRIIESFVTLQSKIWKQ